MSIFAHPAEPVTTSVIHARATRLSPREMAQYVAPARNITAGMSIMLRTSKRCMPQSAASKTLTTSSTDRLTPTIASEVCALRS